jgi:hypothetical protein
MVAVVAGATGAAIAIAAMELLAEGSAIPLLFVPFATSIVLVMGSPQVAAAQPRALIGGHLVATVVGLVVVKITGPGITRQRSRWVSRSWRCMSRAAFILRPGSTPRRRAQQYVLELPVGPGGGRGMSAGGLGPRLAQRLSSRLLAQTLAVKRRYSAGASPASRIR